MNDPPSGTSRHATTASKQERTFDEWGHAFLPPNAFADWTRTFQPATSCHFDLSLLCPSTLRNSRSSLAVATQHFFDLQFD